MAVQFDPIAKDESLNTTELAPRNVADVLAQELSGIASAISGGSDKVPKTDIATVEPTNVASRAYNIGELVYVNGNLYKVIATISMGSTFTVGTNIQATTISGKLSYTDPIDYSNLVTSAYNLGAVYALKQGSVITLNFVAVSPNNIPNGSTVVSIPADIRPSANFVGGMGTASQNIGDGGIGALFTVQPNGNVVANYETNIIASVVRGIIVYTI